MQYKIPKKFFFRIHHCRPRFKNNVENVLVFMAEQISGLPEMNEIEFNSAMNSAIRLFPGNAVKKEKTINNWRTEISSLFGLVQFNTEKKRSAEMAIYLAETQDLVAFFKYFLFYFQYPGGHLKPHETVNMINAGILFKPAQYILKVLKDGAEYTTGDKRFYINKAETAHCIFNDLRVTRDRRQPEETIKLILKNRRKNMDYDCRGDVIRYPGDILDYMVAANLLVLYGNNYVLNMTEIEAITAFISSDVRFTAYDALYEDEDHLQERITGLQSSWFDYINEKLDSDIFRTDILNYLGIDRKDFEKRYAFAIDQLYQKMDGKKEIKTKEIGDVGECLVHGHECMRIKLAKRDDLTHLIVVIPNSFGVGYDVQSVEIDGTKRYIEVKTTISSKKLVFNTFHMSPNEWNTAQSTGNIYYVYRLMISKGDILLYVIKNPVKLYKADIISINLSNGADVTFDSKTAGSYEELLVWAN